MELTKEKLSSLIRTILTVIGGILMYRGYADETLVAELVGAGSTLAAVIWSMFEKGNTDRQLKDKDKIIEDFQKQKIK